MTDSGSVNFDDPNREQLLELIIADYIRACVTSENIWHWTRLNPRVSALSAAVLCLTASLAIGSTVGLFVINEGRLQAKSAQKAETKQKIEVERQKALVEGQRNRTVLAESEAKEEQRASEAEQKTPPEPRTLQQRVTTKAIAARHAGTAADADDKARIVLAAQDKAPQAVVPQVAEPLKAVPYDAVAVGQQDRKALRVRAGDWPQWGGSRLRNNTPSGRNIPSDWDIASGRNIKWAAKLGSQTYGSPSIANGKIFIGTNNANGYLDRYPAKIDLGVLLCFEETTGKFLWQYSSPKLPTGRVNDWPLQGMPSTPVIDGDRLWAVTNRCEVVCLDTDGFRDGENDGPYKTEFNENPDEADVVWRFDMISELHVFPHNMSNCSILIADGVLFLCTSNGVDEGHIKIPQPDAPSFLAMDRETGKVLWSDNSPGLNILHAQWASPCYAVFGGQPQVIFPGGDGWVYSFDPKGNGAGGSRLLWKFDANPKESIYLLGGRATRNQIIAFPAIYDGLVYIVVGEDPEHGEGVGHLWCIDPSKHNGGEDVSEQLAVDFDGNVIPHRRLQAVDIKKGEAAVPNPDSAVCWHYFSHDQNGNGKIEFEEQFHRSLSTPTIKDNILYLPDFAGLVHCLDAKSGEVYWTHDAFSAIWGSALVVEDKVYVGDEDGIVHIYGHSSDRGIALPNGVPVAEPTFSDSIYSTPVVANNGLYVATKNTLYAIAQGAQIGVGPDAIQTVKNSIAMELALIPPGKFQMGGRRPETGSGKPVEVTLSHGFYMGKTEVTQSQWKAVMGTMPWKGQQNVREGDRYPATYVSWDDAQAFCVKLSEKEKLVYRLPTEAQWEYACSARATTRYSFGDEATELGEYAWWGARSPLGNTRKENYAHEVATKHPNRFGLHDMHGNVWEWCDDLHIPSPPGGIDPRVFDGGTNRVFRGGSWDSDDIKCRSAFRFANFSKGPKSDQGFRVVRDMDSKIEYQPEWIPIRSLGGQHNSAVTMAVFSPDGAIVASASEDNTVVLWRWQDRKLLHVLKGHSAGVLVAAFSPDGKTLATGGRDSKIFLWNVETGAQRALINDHTAAVSAVLYSQNGTTLVTGSSDKTIKVRDIDGNLRFSLAGHQQELIAMAFADDGKTIISAGGNWHATTRDGELKCWDLQTRQMRWSADGVFGGIWSVAVSPVERKVAGGSLDGTVRIWDVASGQLLSTNRQHTNRVLCVAYEPITQLLMSSGLDGQMYYWDANTLRGRVFTQWNNHRVQRFSFSPRGRLVATAGADATVTIWHLPGTESDPPPNQP